MRIATQCPHCGKAYQVAETSVDKQVKCQACGKAFIVRAMASAAGRTNAAQSQRVTGATAAGVTAASSTASGDRARIAKLEAELGLQPLPPNPNKVFPETDFQRPKNSPSPLANHVIDDPGFEQLSEAELTAQRQAEAAAREAEALTYGKDEDELAPGPAREKSKGEQAALGVAGVVLFYVIGNIIVYFATNGESLLMPKAVARLLNLAQ
jgi:DNA-directed RNA polymerase subunit RPC12/RpoP